MFSKHGLLAKNIDDGDDKIKMYADDNGNFKGEALISAIPQIDGS